MEPGCAERLRADLGATLSARSVADTTAGSKTKVVVNAPRNRRYTAWIGGRELAGHESFPDSCIYAEDYEESGLAALTGDR